MEFNDAVKEAMGKSVTLPPSVDSGYIYDFVDVEHSIGESWPTYFKHNPSVGDLVESSDGRQLEIKTIVHKQNGRMCLVLGRNLGGSSADSGGGSQDIMGATV